MTSSPLISTDGTTDGQVVLEVAAHPVANLALLHNGVPVIQELRVGNVGADPIPRLRISATLLGLLDGEQPQWSTVLKDLKPGQGGVLDRITEVVPDRRHLQSLTEAYDARLRVVAGRDDAPDVVIERPLRILARNEWFAAPFCLESLATFVEPNFPAVAGIKRQASDILLATTGDGSLQGYQAGSVRAGQIAAALYAALANADIRYVNPPASFENTGQKIRSPQQVLDEGFGTCLDLSVLYAACLEAVGLHPLLWIVDGHAFVGLLRDDATLADPVVFEPNRMINLAKSGQAIIVEADFYLGPELATFRRASERAQHHLDAPHRLIGVIDVSASRRVGVKPFPPVATPQPESVAVAPQAPRPAAAADLSLPAALTVAREDDQVLDLTDDSPLRVKRWKRSLLDLSTRNRLLNLRPSREVVYLTVSGKSLPRIDDLIHAGKKITLRPMDDVSGMQHLSGTHTSRDLPDDAVVELLNKRKEVFAEVSGAKYTGTFKHLQRTARTLLEETGSTNLYLTFGALVHTTATGRPAVAPLFLLPIRVVGGGGNSPFEIVADTSNVASPNDCLIEWLRVKHNVRIDALSRPPTDDSGIDIDAALAGIRTALLESKLDFRIEEWAAVAICKFGTLRMWQDLQEHWSALSASPLASHLAEKAGDTFIDPGAADDAPLTAIDVDEVAEPLPVQYDGSQLKAVELATLGRTFVLQGPPGTGKSQTITNLIARNLVAGRTVLFVAEKQAALDVVRRRLNKVGLAPFVLDMHGAKQSKDSIRTQIKESLEYRGKHNELSWNSEVANWRLRYDKLAGYPDKIHGANGVGQSLWEAADAVASNPTLDYLPLPDRFLATATSAQLEAIHRALVAFGRTATPGVARPDSPWVIAAAPDTAAIGNAAYTADRALGELLRSPSALTIATELDDPRALWNYVAQAKDEVGTAPLTVAELDEFTSRDWSARFASARRELAGFLTQAQHFQRVFHGAFLQSGDAEELAAIIRESQHGVFGKRRREEDAVAKLRSALQPGVDLRPEEALRWVDQVPGLRAQRAHAATAVHNVVGRRLPAGWDPLDPSATRVLDDLQAQIAATVEFANNHSRVWRLLRQTDPQDPQTLAVLDRLVSAWVQWTRAVGASTDSLTRWLRARSWLATWRASQPLWATEIDDRGPDVVHRYVALEATLAPLREAGLDDIADALIEGRIPAQSADARFYAGLARASVDERLRAGGLTSFAHDRQDGSIDDFADVAQRMRTQTNTSLPARLAAMRAFDPDRLQGKYGQLRRALDGKRNTLSIRDLITQYGPEIQSATPCFLVSPGSLAQYVEPGSIMFDLVVFDEASQVTVAQSIGAIGRARSAVIVGDSKQMPPTVFGIATTDSDDDGDDDDEAATTPEDLESILSECLESGIPALSLTWHYRSQDESLIAFSNEKYYERKLATLPSPGKSADAGVEFRRVNGHFNREDKKVDFRTNRVEAEAIVAEIRRVVALDAKASIGVVTFNRQQQDLLLNLLEETGDPRILALLAPDAEDGLFVKNLENVQGDERDTILFSTAFSKALDGKPLPLNFGPLTRVGGEKRLNVAVTRARRKVGVFSSFDPSDIDLNRTRSEGMAHLRAYLETAASGTVGGRGSRPPVVGGLEDQMADALRARGLEVQRGYGMSEFVIDIAVRSRASELWQVAVMLDGPAWNERDTVADRDLAPRLLHDMMGWSSVQRVWLPEWLQDPDAVVDRIVAAVEVAEVERREALAAVPSPVEHVFEPAFSAPAEPAFSPSSSVSPPAPVSEPAPAPANAASGISLVKGTPEPAPNIVRSSRPRHALPDDEPDVAIRPAADFVKKPVAPVLEPPVAPAEPATPAPEAPVVAAPIPTVPAPQPDPAADGDDFPVAYRTPYVAVDDTPLGIPEDLNEPLASDVKQRIRDALVETIAAEGPIQYEALCKRIVRRFGYGRVAEARVETVGALIPGKTKIRKTKLGRFVWPEGVQPAEWGAVRTIPAGSKRDVNEVCPEEITNALVILAGEGIRDRDPLIRATLAIFGVSRKTENLTTRVDACLTKAIRSGRISLSDG